jgi:hypothetical protein
MRALSILGCCAEIACRHLGVEPTAIGGDSARTETNSSRGWCIELIAGTTATSRFAGLKNTGKNWHGIQAGFQNDRQNEI